jgi:cell division control protein 24
MNCRGVKKGSGLSTDSYSLLKPSSSSLPHSPSHSPSRCPSSPPSPPSAPFSSASVMASVAGRKKSMIYPGVVQIDIPIGTNTLLNKAASQSTSLYQQCSALRSRLLRIHGFPQFFALSSPTGSFRSSAEVVNTVWDCFALGTPLCYLFNLLLPPITPIDIDTDPLSVDIDNERAKKRAIALFAIQVKQLNHGEQFTVTDLWDRTNSDGFVKVCFISVLLPF